MAMVNVLPGTLSVGAALARRGAGVEAKAGPAFGGMGAFIVGNRIHARRSNLTNRMTNDNRRPNIISDWRARPRACSAAVCISAR